MTVSQRAIDERRVGRMIVSGPLWRDPASYRDLLTHFLPARVDFRAWDDSFDIVAWADEFDPTKPGQRAPRYKPEFRREGAAPPVLVEPGRLPEEPSPADVVFDAKRAAEAQES